MEKEKSNQDSQSNQTINHNLSPIVGETDLPPEFPYSGNQNATETRDTNFFGQQIETDVRVSSPQVEEDRFPEIRQRNNVHQRLFERRRFPVQALGGYAYNHRDQGSMIIGSLTQSNNQGMGYNSLIPPLYNATHTTQNLPNPIFPNPQEQFGPSINLGFPNNRQLSLRNSHRVGMSPLVEYNDIYSYNDDNGSGSIMNGFRSFIDGNIRSSTTWIEDNTLHLTTTLYELYQEASRIHREISNIYEEQRTNATLDLSLRFGIEEDNNMEIDVNADDDDGMNEEIDENNGDGARCH